MRARVYTVPYSQYRPQAAIGDFALFQGDIFDGRKPTISGLIRWWTDSDWSHGGFVVDAEPFGGRRRVKLIESTTLNGKSQVVEAFLSDRVRDYPGRVAIAQLKHPMTEDQARRFYEFMTSQVGKPYDVFQVLRATFDILRMRMPHDYLMWFCTELGAAGYQESGYPGVPDVLPKTVTPEDMRKWSIFNTPFFIELAPTQCQNPTSALRTGDTTP